MNSVVFKSIDRNQIKLSVDSFVDQLRKWHPEFLRAIWFGSWVNGLPSPGSDVDICLIVSSSGKPARERFVDYLPLGFPVGVDLFVYTRDEFERLKVSSPDWYKTIISGVDI